MGYYITLPDNVDELTLEAYQRVQALDNPTEAKVLQTLLGLTNKQMSKVALKDIRKMSKKLDELFAQEAEFAVRFEIDNIEYGFIPKLDDITYGENKDITAYLGKWESMNKAMAVMYRPITARVKDKYEIEEYEGSHKYAEIMKQAPLGVVLGAMVFFCNLTNELVSYTQSYLESKEIQQALLEGSAENGDLLRSYIHSLRETYADLTRSLNYASIYA